jgi:hypothetical protein
MAEVRFGGGRTLKRSASISATSAFTGQLRSRAALSSARQKAGSRLIEDAWPAISTDRLAGGA